MLGFLELPELSEQRLVYSRRSRSGVHREGAGLVLDTVCLPSTVTGLGNFLLEDPCNRLASFFPQCLSRGSACA